MSFYKPTVRNVALLFFTSSLLTFSTSIQAQDGKTLFNQKCASCHQVFKPATGPALMNLEERHTWSDHDQLLSWIQNPAAYMASDPYTQGLKAQYGSMMQAFPDIKKEEVDAIVSYINQTVAAGPGGPKGPGGTTTEAVADNSNTNAVIFGVISLILAVIALILMQVNSNLKKLSDDKEGIVRPEPVPFYRNKIYIGMLAILLFIVGGYYVSKGAIGLGRQKGYEPVQPIFYSHKVHAGINQINCLYCHSNALDSKHATVPSVNVCMNCHKAIQEYAKGPQLYTAEGKEVDGTAEIAKLYKFAGFDPSKPNDWTADMAKPIEWIKIHNLPDHVFFSHAQHTKAGQVQCQTCHGEINKMDEVYQFADLSMGWCINCHRETAVNFNYTDSTGNQFYSIYQKFHDDIKAGKMDSVRVKDIGGLECQRCHY